MGVRTCRYCRRTLKTTCFDGDFRVCRECVSTPKHLSKEELENNDSKDLCKYCEQEFVSLTKIKKHVCEKCKNETDEYYTTCVKCDQKYSRENNFNHKKFICDECAEAINAEKYFNKTYRYCGECKEYKPIGKQITYKCFFCHECEKKRRKKRSEIYRQEHKVAIV